jgi:hypothetical protein
MFYVLYCDSLSFNFLFLVQKNNKKKKKVRGALSLNSKALFITFSIELMGVIIYILYDTYTNAI